ncbi:SRA stem-loop-interacting RNA-binding protein, mitochondrial [Conger conger]|nr:SRA stem-loop-interacting RNA-binding protein, mitochondrial [Conger conger]
MAANARNVFVLFVSRIPWTLANKEIREYFMQFGQIRRCVLPFNEETGFHRGFCRITYTNEEGLEESILNTTHVVEGSRLLVQQSNLHAGRSGEKDDS